MLIDRSCACRHPVRKAMHCRHQGPQLQRKQRSCGCSTITCIGQRDFPVARRSAPGDCGSSPCNKRLQKLRHTGIGHAVRGSDRADSSTEQLGASASAVPADDEGSSLDSPPTRLFSSLNETTLRHQPGSVLGAAALVAGTTVGAGILALPYATKVTGHGTRRA